MISNNTNLEEGFMRYIWQVGIGVWLFLSLC